MNKKLLIVFCLSLTAVSGCTTATYGKNLRRVSDSQDRYTIKIYTGGFAFKGTARERAEEEIEKFMEEHKEYSSYEILSSDFELIPSGTRFVVEFKR